MANTFEMEISPEQSETLAFSGQHPVRCKITVDNKSLQLKNTLNIFVVTFPMKMQYNIQQVAKFSQILGILNITFKPTLVQKSSRIKVYSAVAVPILLHGSEFWALRKRDKKRYQLR